MDRPLLVLLALSLCSCSGIVQNGPGPMRAGPWKAEFDLGGERLPFLFEWAEEDDRPVMRIHNGEESILVDEITRKADSLTIRLPLYDSEFVGLLVSDSVFQGYWHNHLKGPDYKIPFTARAGDQPRFEQHRPPAVVLSGVWETHFSPGGSDAYDALGLFHTAGARVTGTFGTETGDYRYLDGSVVGDSLLLSCFDGSHAFLFKAILQRDTLRGRFWSGIHWQEPWFAVRNPDFHLRSADSLTQLAAGTRSIDFSLPSIDGGVVSPRDVRHMGNVQMVQIMGSWCPNCLDETLLLDEMYDRYHDRGLDVIAIAFEKQADPDRAVAGLRRYRDKLGLKYDLVYAGAARKENVHAQLPFLDSLMSYPTCIFLGRDGTVRRIRSGFYGPSTGEYYLIYKKGVEDFLEQLLAEKEPA